MVRKTGPLLEERGDNKTARKICWECGYILEPSKTAVCPICGNERTVSDPLMCNSFAHQNLSSTDVFYERQEDGILYTFTYPLYLELIRRTLPGDALYLELIRTMLDLGWRPAPAKGGSCAEFTALSIRAVNFYLRRDFALFYRRICAAIYHIFWSGKPVKGGPYYEEVVRYETEEYHFLVEKGIVILTDVTKTKDSKTEDLTSCRRCEYRGSKKCSHCSTAEIQLTYHERHDRRINSLGDYASEYNPVPVDFTYGFIAEYSKEIGGSCAVRRKDISKMLENAAAALLEKYSGREIDYSFSIGKPESSRFLDNGPVVFYEFDRTPQEPLEQWDFWEPDDDDDRASSGYEDYDYLNDLDYSDLGIDWESRPI